MASPEINPLGEPAQSNESLAAEIRAELERNKKQREYLEQLLAIYDPEELSRQHFIDRFYEGE